MENKELINLFLNLHNLNAKLRKETNKNEIEELEKEIANIEEAILVEFQKDFK